MPSSCCVMLADLWQSRTVIKELYIVLTAHSCTFMSSEIGQTCSLAFMSPFECTVFEFFFFCLHYCVVRILGSGLPLWGAHPSGWLPFKYVGHRSLTTSLAQLFLLWLIGSSSLTLSACRFNWWLHGRTGCVGGAVTSEGRASDESRAGASGELRIQKKN